MIAAQFNVVARRDGSHAYVVCDMEYDPEGDPLVVQATFLASGEEDRVWVISRELLARGVTSPEPYGDGDIKLRQEGAYAILCLQSPDGHADLVFARLALVAFIEKTAEALPIGSEDLTVELDEWLETLG